VDELLTFGVALDTSGVEEGLREIGDVGARASAQLEDSLSEAAQGVRRLEAATDQAADRMRRLDDAADGISDRAGKSATAFGMIGGVLGRVNPQLEDGTRLLADLADAVDVASMFGGKFLRVLGPLGIALGVVGTAYAVWRHETEAAAEAQRQAEERVKALTDALNAQYLITNDLQNQINLVNGLTDQFAVALEREQANIRDNGEAVIAAIDAQIAAQKEAIRVQEQERRVSRQQQANIAELRDGLAYLNSERADAVEAMESQMDAAEALAEYRREEAESNRTLAERDRLRAEAARKQAEAAAAQAAALQELAGIQRDQALSEMTEREKINFLLQEKITRLQELAEITGEDVTEERLTAERIALEEIAELERAQAEQRQAAQDQLDAQRQAAHDQEMAAIQAEKAARMEALGNVGAAYGDLANLAAQAANKRATIDEASARRSLQAAKSLGLVQIAIDTAVGIQKALAQAAGRPLRAAAGIAAVLTGSAVQTAAVASQSLHSGGDIAPDEQEIRTIILRDEAVTSRGEVLSPEESRQRDTGGSTIIIPAYQHFGQFFADVVESGGTPLHHLINEGRTLGRVGY
jgi:hypothetical protein